ncbi:tetratricopeptide repeat protein [Fluviispira multicolorata]|uniref:Tetratricopeptide repeat protein n=1 Tax=Fluviispira multicolorata TaxID=2654512 RepID=A0A833N515_9BACT|nr:tetratricopeptide repeat protein [Fluviispira multicolorata]KAB8033382.1 tetratricopeptide repeat protein [Fluviispira multicolorata]
MADANTNTGGGKICVLIVEEKADLRTFFMGILTKSGNFDVKNAATAKEALDILAKESNAIHVVVFDWSMVDVSGSVFVQKLRRDPLYDHIEFVVCSQALSQDDSFLMVEVDVHYSIIKPVNANDYLKTMELVRSKYNKNKPINSKLKELSHLISEEKIQECDELLKTPGIEDEISKNPRFVYLGGEIRILKKQYGEAVEFLKNFFKNKQENPAEDNLKSLSTLGKALCLVGRFDEALIIFQKLEDKSPKNLSHKVMVGDALLGLDNIDGAEEKYGEVLENDSTNKDALIGMTKSNSVNGNYEQAKSFFEKIEGNFESRTLASFYNNKGVALVRSGKVKEAILFYENALQLFDKFKGHVYFNLGMAYYRDGNIASALSCFQAALATDELDLLAEKKILKEFQDKGIEKFTADYKDRMAKKKR